MEKIDKAKEDTYPERKDKYRGEPNFATIDKTPYRGYGFSEVRAYWFVAFNSNTGFHKILINMFHHMIENDAKFFAI